MDTPTRPHRRLVDEAIRVVLQHRHDTLDRTELRTLWCLVPKVVDEFISDAGFREPPPQVLHRSAALGLWQHLERATLVTDEAHTVATLKSFASLPLPQLVDLTLLRFGRTDPAGELAALAGARWPQLRLLEVCISASSQCAGVADPGEEWAAAVAALSAARLPVQTLELGAVDGCGGACCAAVDFPLTDIVRCFAPTLTTLRCDYNMGEGAAAALAAHPPAAPELARLDLLRSSTRLMAAMAAAQTPWPSVTTFTANECQPRGALGGFGAALPAVTDLRISWAHGRKEDGDDDGFELLKGLEATAVRKVVLRWPPGAVLHGAAEVTLPSLRTLTLRYVKAVEVRETSIHEDMRELLGAGLPCLEQLTLSFGSPQNDHVERRRWREVTCPDSLPPQIWPALQSFSCKNVVIGGDAAELLRRRVLHRVPKVDIQPALD